MLVHAEPQRPDSRLPDRRLPRREVRRYGSFPNFADDGLHRRAVKREVRLHAAHMQLDVASRNPTLPARPALPPLFRTIASCKAASADKRPDASVFRMLGMPDVDDDTRIGIDLKVNKP